MPRFSDEEIRRYARQMVLPEVGGIGQERLRATRAVARGEVEALYLAGSGVGVLIVPSAAIAEAVRSLNPLVDVSIAPAEVVEDEVHAQSQRALAVLLEALGL